MFRKPKKVIKRRVFIASDEEDAENNTTINNDKMDIDIDEIPKPNPSKMSNQMITSNQTNTTATKKEKKKDKKVKCDDTKSKRSLLSFADDEDEEEVFQVKKSSHSKKMMRMLDKERRKKKLLKDDRSDNSDKQHQITSNLKKNYLTSNKSSSSSNNCNDPSSSTTNYNNNMSTSTITQQKNYKNSDSIQTEIRTDDFVLVVKKSEPENIILNGRAALCAGRDDMSSEYDDDDDDNENNGKSLDSIGSHRFAKPDNFKLILESGSIPDAAMIHAARKRRQKARELGDFIPIEEQTKESLKRGKRLIREENEDDVSEDEERVDMNAITGIKEREERREKFYSVQNEFSGDDSDQETNEWENQQIRKGVTGAQLVTAAQESVLSQFVIKSSNSYIPEDNIPQSTATLLEQAYAKNYLERPKQILSTQKNDSNPSGPRTPQEVTDAVRNRLIQLRELNVKHKNDIQRIIGDLRNVKIDAMECTQRAPTAAAKYRFYQELLGYITDLVECLDEKAPKINELEKRTLQILSKHSNFLIERRRQDVRDQAKEISEFSKLSSTKKGPENEGHVRRAAAREGRRTRRRCEREKNEFLNSHLDGMSSDDERPDQDIAQYKTNLDQLEVEADDLFVDTRDDFCKVENILSKFEVWRDTDMDSYKEAFVSLCLPKIVGPLIRLQMLRWNPLEEKYQEVEKMNWYMVCMRYGWTENETEESLIRDPDVRFVPTLIEKIILPKITEIIENCWDPLSTSQTLRIIGLINRLGRDYSSLKESSKILQTLFNSILDKIKLSLDNDVFIPIFPNKIQEAKSSFFQRQFCSGLKLFRNILSWQGVIGDKTLIELAISSLLNRYLLSAMRVCAQHDAISKANLIVNTLPTAWLQSDSNVLESLINFIAFVKYILEQLDKKNPLQISIYEKAKQTLQRLHCY